MKSNLWEGEKKMFGKMKYVVTGIAAVLLLWWMMESALSQVAPRPLTPGETSLISADNAFGFKLFREITKTQRSSNIFISPFSVSLALGMTVNGASGATRDSMLKTLELSGMTMEGINQSCRSLTEFLLGLDSTVRFQIANSIWYRRKFSVEKSFLDINKSYFNAEVSALDFSDPGATSIINAWVDRSTQGKIKQIVDPPIDPLTMMFLIDAIYFKGAWTEEFNKRATRDGHFYIAEGDTILCKMMSRHGAIPYLENDLLQAVDLRYGNGCFSLTVLLPRPRVGLDSLIAQFSPENWRKWSNSFAESEGELQLPKFKLEYERLLNNDLTALGMGIAFDSDGADFTSISKGDGLFINEVKHKTFVDVNEESTEAAAVTSVELRGVSDIVEGFVMHVNRPFVFVIRDHHSGTLLFMGRMVRPTTG